MTRGEYERACRDIGTGVLPARESAEPHLGLLSSPTLQALRDELIARGGGYAAGLARGRAVRMALQQVMSEEVVSAFIECHE